jgi:phosphate transport system substrate-binding protein
MIVCIAGTVIPPVHADDVARYPVYAPVPALAGELSSMGSDTLVYVMSFWAVEFKRMYPQVRFNLVAPGSATAPAALTAGLANLGPMSRRMKEDEIAAFVQKHGYPPTEIRIGLDTLAVYVNRDNPVKGMTLAQVDAIFSSARKCRYPRDITRWGQLGLGGEWAQREVQLFGRNRFSGTRAFFAEHALCRGEYKKTLKEMTTSVDVVSKVGWHAGAIGYSGVGYRNPAVRVIPLADRSGTPYIEATRENAISGAYPLTRYLYVYVNKDPSRPLPPLEQEFMRMVLSGKGQAIVENDGFIPLAPGMIGEELAKLE